MIIVSIDTIFLRYSVIYKRQMHKHITETKEFLFQLCIKHNCRKTNAISLIKTRKYHIALKLSFGHMFVGLIPSTICDLFKYS